MKYTENNKPLVCMMTNSTCYKGTSKMKIRGILWHSTAANNPTIKRYVQPSDNDPNRDRLLAIIGKNLYHNDWNHIYRKAGLNAWVGKLADGKISSVQTMPWDFEPWGCGKGRRGSCNDGWIQFEICEDDLTSREYFLSAYREAVELTAYLCKKYNINPHGSVEFKGIKVPTILCHQDSYKLGLGSNHADVYHWFNKFGYTMENVRDDVGKLLKNEVPVKVTYQVHAKGRWLPNVVDRTDYAGNFGQPVDAVFASADHCDLIYKVSLVGGKWLPEVKNREDFAGIIGKPIDRIMVKSTAGNTVHVQAHTGGKWLPPVTGYNEKDWRNGYAGNKGQKIDAIYIWADPIKKG